VARRSLPERTVDAWVTTAINAKYPNARLWAPTQNDRSNWDTGLGVAGKAFIFEDKATTPGTRKRKPPKTFHRIDIDTNQLHWYCTDVEVNHAVPAYYVLPNPPWAGEPTGSDVLPDQVRHQQTFATWAWVIRCTDLRIMLASRKHLETHTLPGSSAITLEDFLQRLWACQVGRRVTGKPTASQQRDEVRRLNIGTPDVTDQIPEPDHHFTRSSLAVFVPSRDLSPQPWFD